MLPSHCHEQTKHMHRPHSSVIRRTYTQWMSACSLGVLHTAHWYSSLSTCPLAYWRSQWSHSKLRRFRIGQQHASLHLVHVLLWLSSVLVCDPPSKFSVACRVQEVCDGLHVILQSVSVGAWGQTLNLPIHIQAYSKGQSSTSCKLCTSQPCLWHEQST